MVQGIRKRFFRSGAVHELKIETVRQWSISNTADLCYDTLVEIQDKVQAPLEQYWYAVFLFSYRVSTPAGKLESHVFLLLLLEKLACFLT